MKSTAHNKRDRLEATVVGLAVSALSLAIGCGDPSSSKPSTGGSTHDFGGSKPACTDERSVELDERIDALGYSPREVVESFGRTHTFRVAWVPNCSSDSCLADTFNHSGCGLDESQLPSFASMQSEITISVRPTGAAAMAVLPGPQESPYDCGSSVVVPIELTFESDDGVLDSTIETGLGPFDIDHVGIGLNVDAADLGGRLAEELPEGAAVEATIEAVPGGFHVHFVVLVPDSEGPGGYGLLLEGLLLPDMECASPFQPAIQG